MAVVMKQRKIIHVDMDAFFAAIEVRDNPKLAGKPLIIGALPNERGVVSTCSYEARKYGVHSAMSIKEAYRRCPNGIYMHPNFRKYKQASDQLHEILSSYSDLVEFVALDEGYVDVTGSEHLFGGAEKIGHEMKDRIFHAIGTTCSVGIGYCMMAAKMASEENKPNGFYMINSPEEFQVLVFERPIGILPGVGNVSQQKFANAGIYTVGDLLRTPPHRLERLGSAAEDALRRAKGIDTRRVASEIEPKSVGNEHTFQTDITNRKILEDMLVLTARQVGLRLKFQNLYCKTVTLKIKFSDMKSITRAVSGQATNDPKEIFHAANSLLHKEELKKPVRLIGISTSNLTKQRAEMFEQLTLDTYQTLPEKKKNQRLDEALMQLYRTYGKDAVKTGKEIAAERHLYNSNEKTEP